MSPSTKTERPSVGRIRLALPAKVTGIVFWGMVLVGLLLAVYLLNIREQEIASQLKVEVVLLSHELENVIEQSEYDGDIEAGIEQAFRSLKQKYSFEGIRFNYVGKSYQFGVVEPGQDQYDIVMNIHHSGMSIDSEKVNLMVFMPSLKMAVAELRKKMLLIIGSLVFLFGLVLQQILQKVLSKPFLTMVMTAEKFASGDSSARFDQQRSDEFGYLATFINRALDAMLYQQHDLESSKKALSEEKERAEVTLHSIMDGVITTAADGRIQYMNPVAERLTGWTNERARDVMLTKVIRFIHEDSGERIINPIDKCLHDNAVEELVAHAALIRQNGSTIPIEASAAPMRNDQGDVMGAVMVFQDVSQARRLTKQLSYQASHDALTGLYNRRMFEEYLETALINVQEEDRHHALCYIDLDQFKIVNDTCGHMAGDELLRQLASILHGCIRDGDILARLGGDEFGVLLENCPIPQAGQIADKIRQQVKGFRFGWQDKSFEIGASIGVVGISMENLDLASIMSAADLACYAAKDMGRNRVHVYEPTDAVLAERHGQMHWAASIMEAIESHRLVLFQQPVIALHDKEQRSHCEILIRMRDQDGQYVTPDAFIPAAERYNLMPKIDRWVIRNIFSRMADGCQEHASTLVAINLSGTSLSDDGLLAYIRETGRAYQVNFNDICFEITETAAISNLAKASHFMNELKKQGCQFSLDDFGSGLSSFAYLKNLPVDFIKIDGAFVKDLSVDLIDRAMVEAITRMAQVMGIQTIAEWVEDEKTLQILTSIGVDFVQGYHLGVPQEITHLNETKIAQNA